MARKRGRITVQNQPTGGERFMLKGIGLIHAVMGLVFVVISVTAIFPNAGVFGLPFLLGGGFFAANGIRILVSKNDFSHRVGYDVETDLDRSIVGAFEDVPDSVWEAEPRQDRCVAPHGSAEARLTELRNLYDRRLITEEEYESKRQEILKEL